MTAERHAPQDDDDVGFALALTLPFVARSDSPDSGRIPTDLATHLSTFDVDAASFAQTTAAAACPEVASKPPRSSAPSGGT